MAIEKFRFVSPGVQINEIDDSIIAPTPPAVGPVVIGRTAKGPAMQPVQVNSVGDLEKVFGPTSNGIVGAADVWRTGVPTSPTLATYAAKAFLQNAAPVTVVRLAGVDTNGGSGSPGWTVDGDAYGLFAVSGTTSVLAGIFYCSASAPLEVYDGASWTNAGSGSVVSGQFSLRVSGATDSTTVSLTPASGNFVRNSFSTNPALFNKKSYFLGETFENSLSSVSGFTKVYVNALSASFVDFNTEAQSAQSAVVVSDNASGSSPIELFQFVGLNAGASTSREIKISIENVTPSINTNVTKYGKFDVVVRKLFDTANPVLERFSGVNLDPQSDNYIAKAIGDSYREWNQSTGHYVEYGSYANRSAYIRVQVPSQESIPPTALPHGFKLVGQPEILPAIAGLTSSFPQLQLLSAVSSSAAKTTRFGIVTDKTNNADVVDLTRFKAVGIAAGDYEADVIFSTRKITLSGTTYVYSDSSYNNTDLLTAGTIAGFDLPMYGGFDGVDITAAEPLVSETVLDSNTNETNSAAYRSVKAAIDIVANPENVDMNVLCVPGLKNKNLVTHMVNVCKARGDAMAIVDLVGDYKYAYENNGTQDVRPTSTAAAISTVTDLALDSSYGAAYFPAVFVPAEGIFLPASVAALGAFGGTEGRSALWFAPAGFNRGGLTVANSGIGVSKTALQLSSTDRDDLYAVNINPIATFPGEGVVIFGQKTLQVTPSALDRVNVRRLVNFIKKQVSRAATRVLFEPNVEATWNNFKGVVNPFLLAIKNAYGLDDAKVVLDSTTTTADLVDRNIMYCKIYIKPTRAIEYVAIDLVVTNSGAAFTE